MTKTQARLLFVIAILAVFLIRCTSEQVGHARRVHREALQDAIAQKASASQLHGEAEYDAEFAGHRQDLVMPKRVDLDFWGLLIPWELELAAPEPGASCVDARVKRYDLQHPVVAALPSVEWVWGLGLADQIGDALVAYNLGEFQDIPCSSCQGFPAIATETACRTFSVRGNGEASAQKALSELPKYRTSKATAKRQLSQAFDERARLLPATIRAKFRAAMDSEEAIVEQRVITTTQTSLGPLTHRVLDYQPNLEHLEDVLASLTETTRLPHLSQPWRSKYPTLNSCDAFKANCSEIHVEIPEGQDYLVVIKDRRGRIVNHGYLRAGTTGKFDVDNGAHTTFFITGRGWNAAKQVPCQDCGTLHGYFNSGVSITKSDEEFLSNHILTFTMQTSFNGNFSPENSDLEELL